MENLYLTRVLLQTQSVLVSVYVSGALLGVVIDARFFLRIQRRHGHGDANVYAMVRAS